MKRYLLTTFFFLTVLSARSQDITLQAEYPSVVESGQQFTISWTVNAGGGEWSAPAFTGFYKVMGPQTSYSSSTQMFNGKVTREITYTYTYYLQAMDPGSYVLAPARFTLKNKTYYSDSVRIEVTGTGAARQQGKNGPAAAANGDPEVEAGNQDLFVALQLNRKEVFVGEPVSASVKIYTRVNLSGINEVKYPSFDKFLKTDIETPPLTTLREENVSGRRYGTGIVQQFLLYPQVPGEITIEPVHLTLLVQQRTGQSDPFFGDFFAQYQSVPKAVASQPARLKVKPLPGSRPADFSGIVGKLDMKATTDRDSVNVNDPVTLKVTISGSGNLKIAATPTLKLPPDIEVFDPKISDDIRSSMNGTSGQRVFEFLLIPRHYGDYTVPPVTYSYFNTSSGRYETLTTREFRFHARKGSEQNSAVAVYGGVSKEDVKYLGKDIRFIRNDAGRIVRADKIIVSGKGFLSIYAAGLFIFLAFLFFRREQIKRNADISAVRNRKAAKIAVRRLKLAEECMKTGETDRFHDEILKGIWGYLSDKLAIPVSELTRVNAVEALAARGIESSITENLITILDTCEFARYSPSASGNATEEIYVKASEFIRSVENKLS